MKRFGLLCVALALWVTAPQAGAGAFETQAQLGEALFFDTILSGNRTQSCATCHAPATAFTDPRVNRTGRAVSVGADGVSVGRRNTPTLSYIATTPPCRADNASA